jgi:ABC-type transport system involved in multi-copper enzyme maturation permease subunit
VSQTLAIFYDAYRNLNAKKMFWLVLLLSALVVVSFSLIGINDRGIKICIWQLDNDMLNTRHPSIDEALFYKFLFINFGIDLWLAWIATILALISTAGIFPDLITSGSIDLLISKPISRLRLFATQYAAGLLFVTLQVTVFCLASFLVIGLRGGVWEPGLFVAVPLVVCFFSYLFSICVFLGMVTRSTVAALLLTLLFWFGVSMAGAAERMLLTFTTLAEENVDWAEMQGADHRAGRRAPPKPPVRPMELPPADPSDPAGERQSDDDANAESDGGRVPRAMGRALLKGLTAEPGPDSDAKAPPATGTMTPDIHGNTEPLADTADSEDTKEGLHTLETAHNIAYGVKTVLPKTAETIELLGRTLVRAGDLPHEVFGQTDEQARLARKLEETIRQRPVWWVVGTSLVFELFVLAGAALVFCRRDF